VKTAFLNGKLKETVYMKLPETVECEDAKNKVALLHKALYGLKQASRTFFFNSFISNQNYLRVYKLIC
jgi:hypothetical protein